MPSKDAPLTAPVLPASFYDRDPRTVAADLLGCLLVAERDGALVAGRIVETEAYTAGDDPASHAFRGPTRRNAAMFGPPGRAYVYLIHTHHCLNVVTEPAGTASAVLLRAVEPLVGLDAMHARRGAVRVSALAAGPGRLCRAFGLDRSYDGWDLTAGARLWLLAAERPPARVVRTPRIGVSAAAERLLRFCDADSRCLSRALPRPRAARPGRDEKSE